MTNTLDLCVDGYYFVITKKGTHNYEGPFFNINQGNGEKGTLIMKSNYFNPLPCRRTSPRT